jgi:hypothetical protein
MKGNNFLHLISKTFIYRKGEEAHLNYLEVFKDKFLNKFADEGMPILKGLVNDENFDGISPFIQALDLGQLALIEIWCT